MPQGLQVWDAAGALELDTSTLLGRVFGSVAVAAGQTSGTISNAQFNQGDAFLVGLFGLGAFTGTVLTGPSFSQVTFSISGTTITWSRSTNTRESNLPAGTLYYGVM